MDYSNVGDAYFMVLIGLPIIAAVALYLLFNLIAMLIKLLIFALLRPTKNVK